MVNIIYKKCLTCNLKQPCFKYPNENMFCGDCKTCHMIDIKNRKCITCNIKQPYYNYANEKQAFNVMIVKNTVWLILLIKMSHM